MHYKIVTDLRPDFLADQVQKLIDLGWQPLGGVAVATRSDVDRVYFYQAMIFTVE